MLPWTDPDFYIQLGGPNGCPRRLSYETELLWRAVIPVVVWQLTGERYTKRVRSSCTPMERTYGWVIIAYVTPAEYEHESGFRWGNAKARATVGDTYGKVWIRHDGARLPVGDDAELFAHELGHIFGLRHARSGFTMTPGERNWDNPFQLLTVREVRVARQAYKMGRGSVCHDCYGLVSPLYEATRGLHSVD